MNRKIKRIKNIKRVTSANIVERRAKSKSIVSSNRLNSGGIILTKNVSSEMINSKLVKHKGKYSKLCLTVTHIFFNDLIDEILNNLAKIPYSVDHYFSLVKDHSDNINNRNKILKRFPSATILSVDNAGKDIGGKLKILKMIKEDSSKTYKYMLFMHDKKHNNTSLGVAWRKELFSSLCSNRSFHNGFYNMETNKNINMISSYKWTLKGLTKGVHVGGKGDEVAKNKLRSTCNSLALNLPESFGFIGGTMFWCDFEKFGNFWNIKRINTAIENVNKEKGNMRELSYTHSLERIFGMAFSSNTPNNILGI